MGYYTRYKLSIKRLICDNDGCKFLDSLNDDNIHDNIVAELQHLIMKEYAPQEVRNLCSNGGVNIKWYEHREEMCDVSEKYPDVVFCLFGVGEDYGDIWKEYYKNGAYCTCEAEIVFPQPDMGDFIEFDHGFRYRRD